MTFQEIHEVLVTEWEIEYNLMPTDCVIKSPRFVFSSTEWQLELRIRHNLLSLYLCCLERLDSIRRVQSLRSQTVEFRLGLKKGDGVPHCEQTFIRRFNEGMRFGADSFATRSNLSEWSKKMLISYPSTIVCKLRSITFPGGNNAGFGFFPGLLSPTEHSDLTIKVKDQEFHAHKVIMAASSEVFSAMFTHKMLENNTSVLNIEDCEPEAFKGFLNFLYTGTTNLIDSNVYDLYLIGHKYCVKSLISYCVGYILFHLSVDNVCEVATFGDKYSDNDITIACLDFFEQNCQKILLTSQWKLLMKNNCLVACKLQEYIASRITVERKK